MVVPHARYHAWQRHGYGAYIRKFVFLKLHLHLKEQNNARELTYDDQMARIE